MIAVSIVIIFLVTPYEDLLHSHYFCSAEDRH